MFKPVPMFPSQGFVTDGSVSSREREFTMINDGGPAFPQHDSSVAVNPEGISIRDFFAGKALSGMLAYSHVSPRNGNWHENSGDPFALASICYDIADAMLFERQKPATIPRPTT